MGVFTTFSVIRFVDTAAIGGGGRVAVITAAGGTGVLGPVAAAARFL